MSADDLSGFSLLDLFREEAGAYAATLEAGLVALESAGDAPARLEELMRAAHSIKGAARIVGLDPLVRLAHALEDAFVAAQKSGRAPPPAEIDVLLAGADLLRLVTARAEALAPEALAGRAAEIDALVARLQALGRAPPASTEPRASATPTFAPPAPPAPEPPAAPPASEPVAGPAPGPGTATAEDASVRVSARSLSRLLALAGEGLVEARRQSAHVRALEGLRRAAARADQALAAAVEAPASDGSAADRLALARDVLARLRADLGARADDLESGTRTTEDLAERLYAEVLTSRMRPFGEVLGALPRLVREVGRELGKRARLSVRGRDVLVDRDVLERLEAPLGHLLRNALDHGVEAPAERQAAGKAPEGLIEVEARHRGGLLEVLVADDGRGVDLGAVRARVVERRLIAPEIARDLSEAELLEFLFLPGFSTRDEVTELSGRGVGLDVVQRLAQDLGGTARAASEPGRGTRFTLVLPITRSVVRAAVVQVAGEAYAFPLTRVERLARLEEAEIASTEGREHYVHEGQPVGLVPAAEALGLPPAARLPGAAPVVQLAVGGERYGLLVERFLGEQDLVVRPLDPRLGKVPNLAAAAVLEDGGPVLVLDTDDLARSVDALLHQGRLRTVRSASAAVAGPRERRRVLVVDDSRTVREVERGLLASRGYAVDVAVDGTDGWNAVRSGRYDLVITDVDMPRMNGIELVRLIKQDAALRRTPVMIVSYKDREEDRQRGLEAGADAYVAKGAFQESGWIEAVVDLVGEP